MTLESMVGRGKSNQGVQGFKDLDVGRDHPAPFPPKKEINLKSFHAVL
jgi:hypothetical protein